MLQTVTVPNPAAGADWSVTVPGAYTWKVLGVRATLTAAPTPPTTAVDSSPNLNNAGYVTTDPQLTFGVAGPFGGGGGVAIREAGPSRTAWIASNDNTGGAFDVATWSVDALVNFTDTGSVTMNSLVTQRETNSSHPANVRFIFGISNNGAARIAATNTDIFTLTGAGVVANTWTHLGFTYDGAQWIGYTNGVAGTSVAGHVPGVGQLLRPVVIAGDEISGQNFAGTVAAVAYYSGTLTAARMLAHSNAVAVSSAAYKAAVLADSPLALWMLDELSTLNSRAAMLDVTDGTTLVMEIPPGLPQANATTRTYSWVPPVASASAGVNDATQIIPLPPITLRPGYTIGTRTPDKLSGDQWSDITVYVDQQASSDVPPGGDPLAFRSLLLLG